jgi:hypothetical protein
MYVKIDFLQAKRVFVTNQTFCYILERVFITICYRSNNFANITFNSIFVTNITMLQIKQYVIDLKIRRKKTQIAIGGAKNRIFPAVLGGAKNRIFPAKIRF